MKREFLINIFLLVGINLLIKPVYIFGIDREVQNAVGVEEYGLYFAVFNFTFLLQIINDFGIHTFNNRHIAQNRNLLRSYFPNVIMLKALLGIAYVGVVFVVAYFFGYTSRQCLPFLGWLCLIHILNSLILYLRSNISGLGWYRTDSWLSSLNKLLMIAVGGVLLWSAGFRQNFEIEWFIWAQVGTLVATAGVALWLIRDQISWRNWTLNPSFLWRIAVESWPYALAIFLMTVYTRVDAVMIERILPDGKAEAGVYAAAYRLLDACNMIGFLFAGLLLPMFARMLKDAAPVNDLLVFSLRLILAGALALAIPVCFFREEIMVWLYDEGTPYWGSVLGFLMGSFVAGCVIYIYSALLTANESLSMMNRLFVVGVLLNVLLNGWLIPDFKAEGAAMATLGTQVFIAGSLVLLAVRVLPLTWRAGLLLQLVGYGAVLGLVCFGIYTLSYHWQVRFLSMTAVAVLLAFAFRLMSLRSLFQRFSERA